MKIATIAAVLTALAAAVPAVADDQGNANAEQQTQPTPNRGGTSGGPAHDARPDETNMVRLGERIGQDGQHAGGPAAKDTHGR